jgi:hypothetical protein
MKGAYMETRALWRPEADYRNHFWILIVGHAVVAFAFTSLYVNKIGRNSPGTGFGYGIVLGFLCWGVDLIRFAVEPLTTKILWMWFAGDLICFALMGTIVGAIYKPKRGYQFLIVSETRTPSALRCYARAVSTKKHLRR